jgi:hypothetical protein
MPLPLAIPIIGSTIAGIALPFFFPSKPEQEKTEIKDKVLSEIKINGFTNNNGTFTLERKNTVSPKVDHFQNVAILIAILFIVMVVTR